MAAEIERQLEASFHVIEPLDQPGRDLPLQESAAGPVPCGARAPQTKRGAIEICPTPL